MKHFNKVMAIMIMAVFSNTVSAAQVNAYHGGDNRLLESTTNYTNGKLDGPQTTWREHGAMESHGKKAVIVKYHHGKPTYFYGEKTGEATYTGHWGKENNAKLQHAKWHDRVKKEISSLGLGK